jgi:teichuronic acid biosynthesis glycosyltransferase TuaG
MTAVAANNAVIGLVSIIMPAYNAARFIEESINSVLAQTYPNWQLLIVDDCSKDHTKQIIEDVAQQDPRIKALAHTTNQGVIAARNLALTHAQGQYIAFLDSDDLWLPNKLQTQLQHLTKQKALICYAAYKRIDEQGTLLANVTPPLVVDYPTLLKGNEIGNLTGLYDCSVLGKEYFKTFRHEDYVAWLALVKRAGQAVGVAECLGCYRVYSGSISSNKFKTLGWQWRIYRESEQIGFLRSCWLMLNYGVRAIRKRV